MNFETDPLQPAKLVRPPVKEFLNACRANGIDKKTAKKLYNEKPDATFLNSGYVVQVYKNEPNGTDTEIWHLSIRRQDREPVHDWRDLQQIKNQICGPEIEALELYPKESRVLDAANQYHLYAIMNGATIPVGYTGINGRIDTAFMKSKQRPFE